MWYGLAIVLLFLVPAFVWSYRGYLEEKKEKEEEFRKMNEKK